MGCCCDRAISCEFVDGNFESNIWDDPDNLIVGGDVVGTPTSENSRVTAPISIPDENIRFRLGARLYVAEGNGNKAGMFVVDAGAFNENIVIRSLGSGDLIVEGKGTTPKTADDTYTVYLEYVIPAGGLPVLNVIVEGVTIEARILATNISDREGELRLMAFDDAKVLSVSIECPGIGVSQCGVCTVNPPDTFNVDISGIALGGTGGDTLDDLEALVNDTHEANWRSPCEWYRRIEWDPEAGGFVALEIKVSIVGDSPAIGDVTFRVNLFVDMGPTLDRLTVPFTSNVASFERTFLAAGVPFDCTGWMPGDVPFVSELVNPFITFSSTTVELST